MFRLMIADDEDAERMGIRFLLEKFGFEFEIREAADGANALEQLKEFQADILVTDVKMPFLSGIDLAKQVRRQFPNMEIIFFSGYDDFEYVKQALSLQAVDYILKPVNPTEFQKVIARVVDRLNQEGEAATQNRGFWKNYVTSRLLNQVSYDVLCQEYGMRQLRFLEDYTRMILLEFEEDVFGNEITDVRSFALMFESVISCPFDFQDLTPSQGVFFLMGIHREDEYVRELAWCIHLAVEKEYRKKCYLAVSKRIENVRDLGNLYQETEKFLEERFFYQDIYVYPQGKHVPKEAIAGISDGQLLQAVEKDVACRDGYSLRRNMEILLDVCRNNGFQSYIYTRFVCTSLMKILISGLPDGKERLADLVERVYFCGSFADLEGILWEVVDELEKNFLPSEDSPKRTVSLVEQYIQEHYKEPLSLDVLAERVFRTPHYLSSIFVQEKGIGINKYIKNVRMEKAKELLKETNMKISDICEQIGYGSVSYFCRSFRNEYGVTPEQYRR